MPWRNVGRNWHEVYLLLLAAATGASGLFAPEARSSAIEGNFPVWGQVCWYLGLLVGSILGVVGILRSPAVQPEQVGALSDAEKKRRVKRQVTALITERVALLLLAGLCVGYVLAVVATVGVTRLTGALGAVFVLGFALANATRAREIRLVLKRARTGRVGSAGLGERP